MEKHLRPGLRVIVLDAVAKWPRLQRGVILAKQNDMWEIGLDNNRTYSAWASNLAILVDQTEP